MNENNKNRVLELIKGCDGYISGQQICEQLNISRTAVWKNINLLKKEGYVIEAVRNKGYHLVMNTDRLSDVEIGMNVAAKFIGKKLLVFDEIDSTNNEAKRMAENGAAEGTLVISDSQTAGKGRRGRSWSSPKGSSIYMTLLLRPKLSPQYASMLTLAAAMAVRAALSDAAGVESMIKWPNDLVVNGRKICGILTEMSADPDDINYVVIGIGINVNMKEFPQDIEKTATSVCMEKGKPADRNRIIAAFCNYFENYYERFLKGCGMKLLMDEYNKYLINTGRTIRVLDPAGEYTGISSGINDNGELIVKKEDGTFVTVMSGEVSVRGVYGYV
jgi:BirA family biotin operon repressor/biotin-[acetyl-CoA-carboxylase] ligase